MIGQHLVQVGQFQGRAERHRTADRHLQQRRALGLLGKGVQIAVHEVPGSGLVAAGVRLVTQSSRAVATPPGSPPAARRRGRSGQHRNRGRAAPEGRAAWAPHAEHQQDGLGRIGAGKGAQTGGGTGRPGMGHPALTAGRRSAGDWSAAGRPPVAVPVPTMVAEPSTRSLVVHHQRLAGGDAALGLPQLSAQPLPRSAGCITGRRHHAVGPQLDLAVEGRRTEGSAIQTGRSQWISPTLQVGGAAHHDGVGRRDRIDERAYRGSPVALGVVRFRPLR